MDYIEPIAMDLFTSTPPIQQKTTLDQIFVNIECTYTYIKNYRRVSYISGSWLCIQLLQ
jgi:hypothetical protein